MTDRVLEAALDAVRAAGAIALRYFRADVRVMRKADLTPVTQADHEAEVAIFERLRAEFPDIGFLGEEFGAQGGQARRWLPWRRKERSHSASSTRRRRASSSGPGAGRARGRTASRCASRRWTVWARRCWCTRA